MSYPWQASCQMRGSPVCVYEWHFKSISTKWLRGHVFLWLCCLLPFLDLLGKPLPSLSFWLLHCRTSGLFQSLRWLLLVLTSLVWELNLSRSPGALLLSQDCLRLKCWSSPRVDSMSFQEVFWTHALLVVLTSLTHQLQLLHTSILILG